MIILGHDYNLSENDKESEGYLDIDELITHVTDPKLVAHNIKLGEQHYNSISKKDWQALRIRAKQDLFFLCYSILGFDKLSVNLHGSVCTWIVNTDIDWRFRLLLLPRGHYKSTIFTIGDSIRNILPDDLGNAPYPLNLGVDNRLCIAHEVLAQSARFLFAITHHFQNNPLLMGLFPEVVPSKNKHRINKYELELAGRTRVYNGEPTIDTMGVGGHNQGRHYPKIKCDDLIGDEARDSETVMSSSVTWFDGIQSYFTSLKTDKLDIPGTRYRHEDLYQHIEDVYGSQLAIYRRPVEEYDEKAGKKIPIFPEEVSEQSLQILRKNKKVFNAQYLNDPDAGDTKFNESAFRYFSWISPTQIGIYGSGLVSQESLDIQKKDKYIIGIPTRLINIRSDLNVYILFDPAINHYGGYCVVGYDEFDNYFVLEAHELDLSLHQQRDWIFEKVSQWQVKGVGIEKVLFSEIYKPWFEAEMRLKNRRFYIHPISTRNSLKETRVLTLGTPLQDSKLYFNEKYYSKRLEKKIAGREVSDLLYQFIKFGGLKDYHVIDALAMISEEGFIRKPNTRAFREALERERSGSGNGRSNRTGYSQIRGR